MNDDLILVDEIQRKAFLGGEFMLWLWYRCDRDEGLFTVGEDTVEVRFDDQLILEVQLAESEQSRLKGGAPAHSPEAYKALQHGKRISVAKVCLAKGEREWVFTVDALTFAMRGMKVPAVLGQDDEARFEERMYLLEELDGMWSALYRQFLDLRLGSGWAGERGAMRSWIAAAGVPA